VIKTTDSFDLETELAADVETHLRRPGCTKRSAVRLAIGAAIGDGRLAPGRMLPPETQLAKSLGVSLGTVQVALQQLQQVGVIHRRRGDGTRVTEGRNIGSETWHFRLFDRETGLPLWWPEFDVDIAFVAETGRWAAFLGGDDGYVRIRRHLVRFGIPVDAEMYLRARLVPGLVETQTVELEMMNIRPYLEQTFGLSVKRAEHLIEVIPAPEPDGFGDLFEIIAHAFDFNETPVYWQRITAPVARCTLQF